MMLRPATSDDWARLFCMRNDEVARTNSLEEKFVELTEHLAWLKRTLKDKQIELFVAVDHTRGVTVGYARLDYQSDKDVICSLAIDAPQRGHGYAAQVINALLETVSHTRAKRMIAVVKSTNYPSLRAFASCGFSVASSNALLVTLRKDLLHD